MFRAEDLPVAATGSIRFYNAGPAEGDTVTIGDGVTSKTFEFDHGAYAVGSIILAAQPADGNTITLSDGIAAKTFEFDDNAAVTGSNISVTIGANKEATMAALVVAINSEPADMGLTATASDPADNVCTLQNDVIGVAGNVAASRAGANITVAGMSGGAEAGNGSVTAGNIAVAKTGTKAEMATALASAINATNLSIRAEAKHEAVLLVNEVPGTAGNVTITETGAAIASTGMSGGLNLYSGIAGDTEFISDGGTTPRSSADRAGDFFNVKEAGAVGDGVTDDTVAIDWARSNHDAIAFPPGNYLYNGNGLEMDGLRIRGYGDCTITLGNGKSLIVGSETVEIAQLRDINISGGFGAIRHTGTGVYVRNGVWIENVRFSGYTGAAISCNAADWPYWRIDGCVFYGANDTATMGIALSGDNAGSVIRRCAFLNNAVHIKHRGNGHNIYLENNDFVRFTEYDAAPRIDLWVVPSTIDTSDALIARGNKFGPENLAADGQDYRVLFADEGVGAENALRMPSATESTGKIVNVSFSGNTQGGSGASTPPFITTRTKVIYQLQITDHIINGTRPSTAVHIEPTVSASDYLSTGNIVSFAPSWNNLPQTADIQVSACNKPGFFRLIDQYAQVNDPTAPLPYCGASSATGFVDMIPASDSSAIPTAGGYSIGAETDALGGTDAAAVTAVSDGSVYFGLGTAVTVGRTLWVEFDVKASGASPASIVSAKLVFNGTQGKFNRNIQLTTDWRRIRIPHIPMAADVNQVAFKVPGDTGTFSIGRVRVYHANEPQIGGHRPTIATADELIAYLDSAGLIVDGT